MRKGRYVDFHTHTNKSDGKLSYEELIQKAITSGIGLLSFTDHNYLMEEAEFFRLQEKYKDKIQLVRGIEVSTNYETLKKTQEEPHVVVLYKNRERICFLADRRIDERGRFAAQREALKQCGIEIPDYDIFKKMYPESQHIGRKLISDYLFQKGITEYPDQGFDLYFGRWGERRAYVDTTQFRTGYKSMTETIREIKEAGGDSIIAIILAHPFYYHFDEEELHRFIRMFKEAAGELGGMEVFYRRYNEEQRKKLKKLAVQYDLVPSAGSDYHGQSDEDSLDNRFPIAIGKKILKLKKKFRGFFSFL